MWPWEHAAIAYIGYRLYCRNSTPSDGAAVALLFGSLFPDLVDKPLAWYLGVLPGGRSLAHSLLVAVPLSVLVLVAANRLDRSELGTAFAIGYLLHLPADLLSPLLIRGTVEYHFLLWPLLPIEASGSGGPTLTTLVTQFVGFLGTPIGMLYLLGEMVLLGAAVFLWHRDGYPGLALAKTALPGRNGGRS